MTTLHPDLLRACAAYLAHADAYSLDSDGQMALLRADAFDSRYFDSMPTDKACDELTHAHLEAIRLHEAWSRDGMLPVPHTAHAILDATPAMLAWWCERLAR